MGSSTLSPRMSPRNGSSAKTQQLHHAAVAPHSPAPPIVSKKPRSSSGSWLMLHLLLCAVGALAFFYWQYSNPASLTVPSPPSPSSIPTPLHPVQHESSRTGLRFYSAPYDPQQMAHLRWGIIFDAGSTGTRVHIYRFRLDDARPPPLLEDEIFVEVKPGLSAFVPKGVGHDASTREPGIGQVVEMGPDAAAESLRPLMELCLEQVPALAHRRTPISLRATAGLRLLGADASESILASIRRLFASYPFPFSQSDVEVMGGSEEGVFAWLTVNYLTGMLREQRAQTQQSAQDGVQQQPSSGPAAVDHPPTAAILDLGGASTQIVFEPDFDAWSALTEAQRQALYKLPYGDNQYFLYESSYLGYGLMEARRRSKLSLLSHPELQARPLESLDSHAAAGDESRAFYHPCLSDAHEEHFEHEGASHPVRGHAQGHASCAALVRTLFPKPHHCPTHPYCSFAGHFALPLRDFDHGIYAFSYFHERTLDIFELEEESEADLDGSVLRLGRLRDLAERVCSFSSRQQQVRGIEEVEAEKEANRLALQRLIAARHSEGCKVVSVRDAEGKVRQFAVDPQGQHVHEHTEYEPATEAVSSIDPSQQPPDAKCMVEDKPDLSPGAERERQQMSSSLSSLVRDNPHLCFDLTYAHSLLHYGYDLPEDTELHIRKRLQKMEVGWCLGAMLRQMAQTGWGAALNQSQDSG